MPPLFEICPIGACLNVPFLYVAIHGLPQGKTPLLGMTFILWQGHPGPPHGLLHPPPPW